MHAVCESLWENYMFVSVFFVFLRDLAQLTGPTCPIRTCSFNAKRLAILRAMCLWNCTLRWGAAETDDVPGDVVRSRTRSQQVIIMITCTLPLSISLNIGHHQPFWFRLMMMNYDEDDYDDNNRTRCLIDAIYNSMVMLVSMMTKW